MPSCRTGWAQGWRLAKGDVDLAEKSFEQAVELAPSRLDAEEALARIASARATRPACGCGQQDAIAAAPRFRVDIVAATVENARNAPDKAEAEPEAAMEVARKARNPI